MFASSCVLSKLLGLKNCYLATKVVIRRSTGNHENKYLVLSLFNLGSRSTGNHDNKYLVLSLFLLGSRSTGNHDNKYLVLSLFNSYLPQHFIYINVI